MITYHIAEMLGQPVWFLRQTMPQDEYYGWMTYLKNKPPDIMEQQIAVLSTLVSNGLGGKAKVTDFLLSKVTEQKPKQITADTLRGAFGGIVNKA